MFPTGSDCTVYAVKHLLTHSEQSRGRVSYFRKKKSNENNERSTQFTGIAAEVGRIETEDLSGCTRWQQVWGGREHRLEQGSPLKCQLGISAPTSGVLSLRVRCRAIDIIAIAVAIAVAFAVTIPVLSVAWSLHLWPFLSLLCHLKGLAFQRHSCVGAPSEAVG
ncbi:unnamed protein product [Menidia menidia]|uniref:(Atlantic silverside) hypothetical protein n=1 Tax=Menidia menidia TaxID=238744 RepID=A0A8S4BF22_9TELE|nr:unnamed protein product [Menidia menidia]